MSRDIGKDTDLSASIEREQLLSDRTREETSSTHVRIQTAVTTDETYDEEGAVVPTSRPALSQDTSTGLNRNAQVPAPPNDPTHAITQPPIIVNGTMEDDDPPPYSAIAPPNHIGWPYDPFSSDVSYYTDATSCRMEMPLALCQDPLMPCFHPEGANGEHASIPMPPTPYYLSKFGYRTSSSFVRRGTLFTDNVAEEKIDEQRSRRYGVILAAAVVIISLMILSLIVHFIMEKSWRRR